MAQKTFEEIAEEIANEVVANGKPKYLNVRTLLNRFGYERRTEDNATKITELLGERNVLLNPSIMKFGDIYPLEIDERVYLVERKEVSAEISKVQADFKIYDYKNDPWFDEVINKVYRTEKEVESKFIIPLLQRLGYKEDDRYDGMPVSGKIGSKTVSLQADLVLFNSECKRPVPQALLVVEVKNQDKLTKEADLANAKEQVRSYSIWLRCHFGLVTDSKIIQVIDLVPTTIGVPEVLFSCNRNELQSQFEVLYTKICKETLSSYYDKLMQ